MFENGENFGGSDYDLNAMESSRHYTNNMNVQKQELINRRSGRSCTPSSLNTINTGQRSVMHNKFWSRKGKDLKIIDSNSISRASSFEDRTVPRKSAPKIIEKVEFDKN